MLNYQRVSHNDTVIWSPQNIRGKKPWRHRGASSTSGFWPTPRRPKRSQAIHGDRPVSRKLQNMEACDDSWWHFMIFDPYMIIVIKIHQSYYDYSSCIYTIYIWYDHVCVCVLCKKIDNCWNPPDIFEEMPKCCTHPSLGRLQGLLHVLGRTYHVHHLHPEYGGHGTAWHSLDHPNWLVVEPAYPSERSDFVSWDHDIPNIY